METKQCKIIEKSVIDNSNSDLRTVIPGPDWTLTISVNSCQDRKRSLVDYEVTTSHQIHYELHSSYYFGQPDPAIVLEMLTQSFKDCKFVKGENGNQAILNFGEGFINAVLPELKHYKVKHLKDLVLKQQEEIGNLKLEVVAFKLEDVNLRAEVGGLRQQAEDTRAQCKQLAEELKVQNEIIKAEVGGLRHQAEETKLQIEEFKVQNDNLKAEVGGLRLQAEETMTVSKQKAEELKVQNEKLKAVVWGLRQQAEDTNAQCKEQAEELNVQNENLKAEVDI